MQTLVISLKRADERKAQIEEEFNKKGVSFMFIDAVDGNELSDEDKNKRFTRSQRMGQKFSPGQVGCTMSHINALKYAKEQEWSYLVVFEDDVIIAEDFNIRLFKMSMRMLPKDWEHLYLSGHPYQEIPPSSLVMNNIYPSIFMSGTHAMVYNSSCFDKMIEEFEKFEMTTDDVVSYMIQEGRLKSYMVLPFVAAAIDGYSYIDGHVQLGGVRGRSLKYFRNKIT